MAISDRIEQDFKESMRAKDMRRISVLRLLKANKKNTAIAKRKPESELTDEEVFSVIRQEVKKRKEAIEAYTSGKRDELVQKEQAELSILESYLPKNLSSDELNALISELVAEHQLQQPYTFGALMGLVVKKAAGRADGATIKATVEQFIADQ